MIEIKIKSSRQTYPVLIDNSFISELPGILKKINIHNNLFIVIDENVFRYHQKIIKETFSNFGDKIYYFILPAGEASKSDKNLRMIYNSLLKNNFGRDSTLIAIGGGVTGDIAGYAAATYMRGINLVHVPTSLLAMIDSSIGNKTGINFKKRKNIIGSFCQPQLVFMDTDFLNTLPQRELISAAGEIIKYGIIAGNNFFSFLYNNFEKIISLDNKILTKVITESVSIKAGVVSRDEFEVKGIRKILNLGHTFAHAFESSTDFDIKHGEAVIKGIICSLYLSNNEGLLSKKEFNKMIRIACSQDIPRFSKMDNVKIANAMMNDKKNINDKLMFVLSAGTGKIIVDYPIEKDVISKVLDKVRSDGFI